MVASTLSPLSMLRYRITFVCIGLLAFLLQSCGSQDTVKSPVDNLTKEMTGVSSYSIILYDMNVEGIFFKDYYHQYRIIKVDGENKPEEKITQWYKVNKQYFAQHQNNMGMEIAAKSENGEVTKTAAPPGYGNYVGNGQYGHWTDRGGTSFWEFYGQYAFLSSMFNLMDFPARRGYYNDYRRYRSSGRSYYGPTTNGRRTFGTNSNYTEKAKPNSTWRSSRFSNRMNSRSGSRYGGSSFRSRGGGFGK